MDGNQDTKMILRSIETVVKELRLFGDPQFADPNAGCLTFSFVPTFSEDGPQIVLSWVAFGRISLRDRLDPMDFCSARGFY